MPARHGDVPSSYPKAETEGEYQIHLKIPQGMNISRKQMDDLGVKSSKDLVLQLK